MFSGIMKRRCISEDTGVILTESYCGGKGCADNFFCGKTRDNPNYGVTSFDNIFYGFLTIFQSVTLEGWSVTMVILEKTFNSLAFLFFFPLIFIGSFFLLNLTLAVIKVKFTEIHGEKKKQKQDQMKIKIERKKKAN